MNMEWFTSESSPIVIIVREIKRWSRRSLNHHFNRRRYYTAYIVIMMFLYGMERRRSLIRSSLVDWSIHSNPIWMELLIVRRGMELISLMVELIPIHMGLIVMMRRSGRLKYEIHSWYSIYPLTSPDPSPSRYFWNHSKTLFLSCSILSLKMSIFKFRNDNKQKIMDGTSAELGPHWL